MGLRLRVIADRRNDSRLQGMSTPFRQIVGTIARVRLVPDHLCWLVVGGH